MTFTRGQIAALIVGSMMFLPGLCFLAFGMDGGLGDGNMLAMIGVIILSIVAALAYFAFRRTPPQ